MAEEALQAVTPDTDKELQLAQHELQPMKRPASANHPSLLRLIAVQKRNDLEGILSACEVHFLPPTMCWASVGRGAASASVSHVCGAQGAQPSPAEAAIALRMAARAAQRLSSPMRIMQAGMLVPL